MSRSCVLSIKNRCGLYTVWFLLVGLNALLSLVLAFSEYRDTLDRAGIATGILSYVVIYAELDRHFIVNKFEEWHKTLLISVVVKAFTQLLPVIEVATGFLSIQLVESVIGEIMFVSVYLKTLLDGALLSVVVMLITLPARSIYRFINNRISGKRFAFSG